MKLRVFFFINPSCKREKSDAKEKSKRRERKHIFLALFSFQNFVVVGIFLLLFHNESLFQYQVFIIQELSLLPQPYLIARAILIFIALIFQMFFNCLSQCKRFWVIFTQLASQIKINKYETFYKTHGDSVFTLFFWQKKRMYLLRNYYRSNYSYSYKQKSDKISIKFS